MKILKKLKKKGVKNISKFAKGHRSVVYKGEYKGKEVAIKIEGNIKGKIKNEIKWLKILNKYNIGPNLIFYNKEYIVYEFINGLLLIDFLKKNGKNKVIVVLKKIFSELKILDELKVDKKELHHPFKHIFISNTKIKMIDFERCKNSKKPKNVSQFCQFLMSKKVNELLKEKGFKVNNKNVIMCLKIYKKDYSEKSFKKILENLKLN